MNAAPRHDPASGSLSEHVGRAVRRYLREMGDQPCEDLYDLVLREMEAPLLGEVMRHCDDNQSRAAELLGINRATLRKKLREHGL